jgi:hypothetical protein
MVFSVFIREEDKLEWWSGPIRSRGGRGSGSQVSGGGECVSLYGSLETLNCGFFPLRRCIRGFHVLLSLRLSSLFMLCGCMSSSMASLMRRSK